MPGRDVDQELADLAVADGLEVLADDLDVPARDEADAGLDRGPRLLDELVERNYLRRVPEDPITESEATWVIVPPRDEALSGVFDVKSGAPGTALDGSFYSDW